MWKRGMLLAVLALTSCTSAVQSKLDENIDLWESKGLRNYDFVLKETCFCIITTPAMIQVRDGEAISVTYISNGVEKQTQSLSDLDTIEDLFRAIQRAIDGNAHTIDVQYDGDYGYPRRISIDYEENATDDEYTYEITSFEAR